MGCEGCVDAVAVSLVTSAGLGSGVRGVAGLLVSGSRGDVSLIVGGAIAWTAPLASADPHDYVLTVDPSGVVGLETDAPGIASVTVAAALPDEALRVVVHGRTGNRAEGAPLPARLLSLDVQALGCDMPDALGTPVPGPLVEPFSPPWPAGTARSPSIARPDGAGPAAARLAFTAGGAIWIARPDGAGGFAVPGVTPALSQGDWAPRGVGEPELVPQGDRWLLLFTAIGADGRRSIRRVEGGAGWDETFDPSTVRDLVALPIADEGGEIIELDGPSAISVGGRLVVVARAIRADGTSAIVLLRSGDVDAAEDFSLDGLCGTGCESVEAEQSREVHEPRREDPSAFDHDEVASPSIVLEGGVYRVYYAGRRGTRWAIGLLVSLDLRFFRQANEGAPVLGPSGAGEDALGVLEPEPWVDGDTFTLLHTASDGVRPTLRAASQPRALR
jgi:hypothetical protein